MSLSGAAATDVILETKRFRRRRKASIVSRIEIDRLLKEGTNAEINVAHIMIWASKGYSGRNPVEIRYIFIAKRPDFPIFY